MKRTMCKLEDVRTTVKKLVGKSVNVKICRGRGRVKHMQGVVSEAHSNVFVVQVADGVVDRISCSYADVACGEIVLKPVATDGVNAVR